MKGKAKFNPDQTHHQPFEIIEWPKRADRLVDCPMPLQDRTIRTCHTCGLVHEIPPLSERETPCCTRCHSSLAPPRFADNRMACMLALAGLAFYLPAMLLPMLRIEKMGHAEENSLLHGVTHMLTHGYWFIGSVVLLFSVVLPLLKLFSIVILSNPNWVRTGKTKAKMYHLLETLGKWGMLDVMLVAILIAFVKLGDLVEMHAGSGIVAFCFLVLLSLFSGLSFHPEAMWAKSENQSHV